MTDDVQAGYNMLQFTIMFFSHICHIYHDFQGG